MRWWLIVAWVVAIVLVDPRADVPLIDDWTYAYSVERIVDGKGFTISSWSASSPVAQIWWGTLWAAVGGFSYTVLRLSTLALAVAGTLAFHGLLRVLGCGPRRALLGAATLLVYPVAFVLSFTFMTDIHMLAPAIASMWAIASALTMRDPRASVHARLVLGVVLATAAFLVRPVALAIPVALLVTVVVHRALPGRRRMLLLVAAALVVMAGTTILVGSIYPRYEGEGGLVYRAQRLRYLFLVSPVVYGEALLSMLAHLGLATLPAWIATTSRRWPMRLTAALFVAAGALSLVAPIPVAALKPAATWSTLELGAARPLLAGSLPFAGVRAVLYFAATGLGLAGAAVLIARTADGLRAGGALRTPAGTVLASYAAVSLAMCFALWFFYDRYYLPLVPAAIAIILIPAPGGRAAGDASAAADALPYGGVAAALVALLFVLDVTGTRDTLAYARTVDAIATRLVASGIPAHQIDAGYVENGWRLYAHPERLPPGAIPERDVVRVTRVDELPYVIANAPLPGYEVRETVPVPTFWAITDRVYVLQKR